MLPFELTKDTPYLALSGELWSVFYEYFIRNLPCYKGFLLYSDAFSWVMVIILLFKFHRNSVQQFQWPRGHDSAKCLVPNRWQTITWTKDQIILCKYVSTYFDVFKTIPPSLILCIPFSNPREIMNIPQRSADFSGREEAMAHFHLHRHAVPSLCIQVCPVGSSR